MIKGSDGGFLWRFTGIYGWSEGYYKYRIWEFVRFLSINAEDLWFIAGDFNEVFFETKKRGGDLCDFVKI